MVRATPARPQAPWASWPATRRASARRCPAGTSARRRARRRSAAGRAPPRPRPRRTPPGRPSCRFLRRPDLTAENLAGRPLRQLGDQPDPARVLVGRHLVLDERAQLVLGCARAGLERDRRADLLAELVVWQADHG